MRKILLLGIACPLVVAYSTLAVAGGVYLMLSEDRAIKRVARGDDIG